MANLIDDTGGQWIALSGLTISLSLIAIAVLINEAAITGYYSSNAAMEFPKSQIRELVAQTEETARSSTEIARELDNSSNESILANFTGLINNFSQQVNTIYSMHGGRANITVFNYTNQTDDKYSYLPGNISIFNSSNNHKIDHIWLNISYDDGTTNYNLEPYIIEMIE